MESHECDPSAWDVDGKGPEDQGSNEIRRNRLLVEYGDRRVIRSGHPLRFPLSDQATTA